MAPCISFLLLYKNFPRTRLLKKVHISSLIFSVAKEARCDKTRSILGLSKVINEVLSGEAVIEVHLERDRLGFAEFSSLGYRNEDLGFLTIAGRGHCQCPEIASSSPPVGSLTHAPLGVRKSGDQLYHVIASSHLHRHIHLSPFPYSGVGSKLQDLPQPPHTHTCRRHLPKTVKQETRLMCRYLKSIPISLPFVEQSFVPAAHSSLTTSLEGTWLGLSTLCMSQMVKVPFTHVFRKMQRDVAPW